MVSGQSSSNESNQWKQCLVFGQHVDIVLAIVWQYSESIVVVGSCRYSRTCQQRLSCKRKCRAKEVLRHDELVAQ
jgi:hypothetical protein